MRGWKIFTYITSLMIVTQSYAQVNTSKIHFGPEIFTRLSSGGTRAALSAARKQIWSIQEKFSSFDSFHPNSLLGYLSNNGLVFADTGSLVTASEGLYWPAGTSNNLVFTSGLWVAGKDERGISRSAISEYVSNYQPGSLSSTFADTNYSAAGNPYDAKFRTLILSDTSSPSSQEYQRWVNDAPVTGAPLNNDGSPRLAGDLNAYWIMNDLDTSEKSFIRPSTPPMGIEIHSYMFGFDTAGTLSNVIFIAQTAINKSIHLYDSTYLGWCSDIDLGSSIDDLPGCDTLLSLGYMYNGLAMDGEYGIPPACGYVVLQSPSSTASGGKMTSFMKDVSEGNAWRFPTLGDPLFSEKIRLILSGKRQEGYSLTPPGQPTHVITFVDPGDPVTGTGWLATAEQQPADNRIVLGSGPFSFAPGDTASLVVAFVVAQDTSRLASITKLRGTVPGVVAKWNESKSAILGISQPKPALPTRFFVSEAYPNPFNPSTTIEITLPEKSRLTVKVYDVLGREVRGLINDEYAPGGHRITWDGKNGNATVCASGVYYVVVRATALHGTMSPMVTTRKAVLLK